MKYSISDIEKWNVQIEEKVKEYGLDCYPQEFEIIGFNEMIGYEAYVGMPSRYPHWSFGKAYEKTKTLYSLNLTFNEALRHSPDEINGQYDWAMRQLASGSTEGIGATLQELPLNAVKDFAEEFRKKFVGCIG